jgi:hypothetical protein
VYLAFPQRPEKLREMADDWEKWSKQHGAVFAPLYQRKATATNL